jgi:hypothetical protein
MKFQRESIALKPSSSNDTRADVVNAEKFVEFDAENA